MLLERNGGTVLACPCSHAFCPPQENWKPLASKVEVRPQALGPIIALHEELHSLGYACPSCGRLLALDFSQNRKDDLQDTQLLR